MGLGQYPIIDGVHSFWARVYYSDTDAGGIMYHARYLDLAEHARTELFRALGHEQSEGLKIDRDAANQDDVNRVGFVVSSLTIEYKTPAFLDDALEVKTTVSRCDTFSLVLLQNIYRRDQLIAALTVKAAYVDLDKGRPKPIPQVWKDAILKQCVS